MFCKLALRNVRRSFRDYGVYLLTLTFGVCLFYTFSSLDGQGAMIYLTQSQNPMAQVIQSCIDVFSVFVAVVLACLILYADRFLMRRRKRELGTYLLLGLSQGQVSLLLVLETGLIGAACVSVVLEVLTNIVVASPETGLFNQFQLGDGGLAGLISWPGLILAAVLLALTNWVKTTKNLHPIVFIAASAVVGVVFRFAGV